MPVYTKDLVVTRGMTGADRGGPKLDYALSLPVPEGANSELVTPQFYAEVVNDPSPELVKLMTYGNKVTVSFDATPKS